MINESKLNNRMLHLMESGFFGKQLLNEASLSLNLNVKIRIFQSFYNYWDAGSNTILVDGNTGEKTKAALEATMKKWAKNAFNKDNIAAIYSSILRQTSSKNLANLKNLKDEHNVRFFQAVLCLAGNTSVIPDGVIGNNTKTIMRNTLGSDDPAKFSDDKLRTLISTAISNVNSNDLSFTVEGLKIGSAASKDAVQAINVTYEDSNIDNIIAKKFKTFDVIFKDQKRMLAIIGNNKKLGYFGKYTLENLEDKAKTPILTLHYYDYDNTLEYIGTAELTKNEISIFSKNPMGYYRVTPDFNTGKQLQFIPLTNRNNIIYTITSDIEYSKKFFDFERYAKKKPASFLDEIKELWQTFKGYLYKRGTFYIYEAAGMNGRMSLLDINGKEIGSYTQNKVSSLFKEQAAKNGFSKKGFWKYDPNNDEMYFANSLEAINLYIENYDEEDSDIYADKLYILYSVSDFPIERTEDYEAPESDAEGNPIKYKFDPKRGLIDVSRKRYIEDEDEDEGSDVKM